MTKKQKGILLGIILLAVILRSIAINSRNIQYDDAFSYFLARVSLGNIVQGTAADTMPPLYYFLLHFWQMVSHEAWFLRLPGVFFSLVSVWLLYLLVQQLFGRPAAIWAALIAAISPFQYYHAQDVRNYSLLLA